MGSSTLESSQPVMAEDEERASLEDIDRLLESRWADRPALIGADGTRIVLPPSLFRVLREAVHALAEGAAVTIVPIDKELTTQQAANILNVSRPYLIRLLERGEIPYHTVGRHRRIRFGDVLAYRQKRYERRKEAIRHMIEASEESGDYT